MKPMIRKSVRLVLLGFIITSILVSFSGCAELQKKFIRKKKKKKVKPIFYQEPIRKTNMELYREHYLYWQGWHKELIYDLGGNFKKVKQDMYEARRHLVVLPNYLEPDYAEKLKVKVEEYDRITSRLKRGRPSDMDISRMKRDLDRLRLRIENNFHLADVQSHLLPDPPPIDLSDYEDEEDFFPDTEEEWVETDEVTEDSEEKTDETVETQIVEEEGKTIFTLKKVEKEEEIVEDEESGPTEKVEEDEITLDSAIMKK